MEAPKKRWWRRATNSLGTAFASAAEVARYRPEATSLGHPFSTRDLGIALALTMAASASLSLVYMNSESASPTPAPRRASGAGLSSKAQEYRAAFEDTFAKLGDPESLSTDKQSQPEQASARQVGAPQ